MTNVVWKQDHIDAVRAAFDIVLAPLHATIADLQAKAATSDELLKQEQNNYAALDLDHAHAKAKIDALGTTLEERDVTIEQYKQRLEEATKERAEAGSRPAEAESREYNDGFASRVEGRDTEMKKLPQDTEAGMKKPAPKRVITCGQCFAHGYECDTGTPCYSCTQRGTVCMRKQCLSYDKGPNQCDRRGCNLAHPEDGYENARKMAKRQRNKGLPLFSHFHMGPVESEMASMDASEILEAGGH